MKFLKQAKVAGTIVILAVLAGCAGQVNEEVKAPAVEPVVSKETASSASTNEVDSSAELAAKAKAAADAAAEAAAEAADAAANAERATAEKIKSKAMAADTLFFFEFDRSDLKQDALNDLDAHAKYLTADRSAKVRLEGHADERGTRAYNLALGERRANSVTRYLVIQGVNRSQIESVSYGEERPLSLVRDDSGWLRNRRVELIYQ
ncbi:peptidoglycan-associated lipoprotein Pal [Litorivicinus sp.]|nr:peptidoglycan-associated lipoprotein Pal [Litorivicinus sp.]